jgi:hypothetical protein
LPVKRHGRNSRQKVKGQDVLRCNPAESHITEKNWQNNFKMLSFAHSSASYSSANHSVAFPLASTGNSLIWEGHNLQRVK